MFFISRDSQPGSTMPTCRGPFPDREAALAVARALLQPGDYTIHGPADAVHKVSIAAPAVTSTAIGE